MNKIDYYRTFDITIYDTTPTLILHFPTNAGDEIVIELEEDDK